MSDLMSRPYKPDPARCCEACAFGERYPHTCIVRRCAKPPSETGVKLFSEMTFDEAWEAAGFAPGEAVGSAQEREEAWEAIRGNLDEERAG
jgi:hypothetical protein